MQFGHRVKSVTLADYKADEVEHMKEGGNQVAAYRYLARYTPDKDLRKPVDRNPQRVRIWIQTVFIDKRFYSADAPVPRRSQEGSGASTPAALTSPAGSLRRSSSSREGSLAGPLPATLSAPVPAAAVAAASRGVTLPSSASSPPVRDMRDLLGDRATALHVGPKLSNEQASSSAGTSRASSVSGLPPTPAAGAAQPSPRPTPPPAFDPFAAPATPVATPAMQATPAAAVPQPAAVQAQPAAAFDPFGQQTATPASAAPAAAAAATSNGWDAFGDAPAFKAPNATAATTPAAGPGTPAAPAPTAVAPGSDWASFGDSAFGSNAFPAASQAPAAAGAPVGVTGVTSASAPAAAASAPAAVVTKPGPAAGVTGGSAAAGSAPVTPSGKGKPPAKELAADMFADFAPPQPVAPAVLPHQQAVMLQYAQNRPAQAGLVTGQQPTVMGVQPQQVPYGMMPMGYGMAQQPPHMMQQQQAMAWQQQQQAAMGMYGGIRPQGFPQQQQQQQLGGMPYSMMMGMNGVVPGAYGAAAGVMGAVQSQPQVQQQQPTTPASPSWTLNTSTAGVTEESAFADLVDLKKALPNVSTPAAAPAMVTSPAQQQQQPYGMSMMPGMTSPGSYGMPGAFGSAPMMQQPMMGQQLPYQQVPYGAPAGMYATGMPANAAVAGQYGMPPVAAPSAGQNSGNPFA
eukprot:GHUV01033019.1.p1 GENE.GHUV01033019.1~~GHUV01033019.1.p1  ORF type:complete len:683 (+),score=318.21 GHUV01033019.1:359-2407(+)